MNFKALSLTNICSSEKLRHETVHAHDVLELHICASKLSNQCSKLVPDIASSLEKQKLYLNDRLYFDFFI